MIELVLWDLDETLLPTNALRDARHGSQSCELASLAAFADIALHGGIGDAMARMSGIASGLVTSSPRWYVDQLLHAFLPHVAFDVVITYDDVRRIKPDPEPLGLALTRIGTKPERAVYIGDDLVDLQASGAAGVSFLGAGWAELTTYPPGTRALGHPSELFEFLEAM